MTRDKRDVNEDVKNLLGSPVAFYREFAEIGGDAKTGLFLSQAVYWSNIMGGKVFYKTQVDWNKEIGLSRHEQESARAKLCKRGIITEIKKGIPCRLHFTVNHERIAELIRNLPANTDAKSDSMIEDDACAESSTPAHLEEELDRASSKDNIVPVGGNVTGRGGVIAPAITENRTKNTTKNNTESYGNIVYDEISNNPVASHEDENKISVTDDPLTKRSLAVCVDVVDCGYKDQIFEGRFKGKKPFVQFVFAVNGQLVKSREMPISDHEKSNFYRFIASWFDIAYVGQLADGSIAFEHLIGVKVWLTLKQNGRFWNIIETSRWYKSHDGDVRMPQNYVRMCMRPDWKEPEKSAFPNEIDFNISERVNSFVPNEDEMADWFDGNRSNVGYDGDFDEGDPFADDE